jgi:hypothetical protein
VPSEFQVDLTPSAQKLLDAILVLVGESEKGGKGDNSFSGKASGVRAFGPSVSSSTLYDALEELRSNGIITKGKRGIYNLV